MTDPAPLTLIPAANRAALPRGFATRLLGALALFVVGGVHLEQYSVAHFSVIPTIGTLFMANFIAATAAGLVLLVAAAPGLRRIRPLLDVGAALAGIGVAAGAIAALLISEHAPLFGFMERGYRSEIVITIVAEGLAIVVLSVFLAGLQRGGDEGP
jgi:hypothetical protein